MLELYLLYYVFIKIEKLYNCYNYKIIHRVDQTTLLFIYRINSIYYFAVNAMKQHLSERRFNYFVYVCTVILNSY